MKTKLNKLKERMLFPVLLLFLLLGSAGLVGAGDKETEQVRELKEYIDKVDEFLDVVDRIEGMGYIDSETEETLGIIGADFTQNFDKYSAIAKKYHKFFPQDCFLAIAKEVDKSRRKKLSLSEFLARVSDRLDQISFSTWAPLQMLKDPKAGIKVQALVNKSPHLAHMISKKNIFDNYFQNLDFKYKIKVFRSALKALRGVGEENIGNDYEITTKVLSKIFQAGGPILQKILQRINDALGSAGLTPFVRDVLKELLVDINPFDDETAAKIVMDRLPRRGIFRSADKLKMERRLGAASMGQAHIVVLEDKRYVIKFIKPGAGEYAEYEKDLWEKILAGTGEMDIVLQNMVGTIASIIKKELNLSNEEKNLKQGQSSYNLGDIKAVGLPAEINQPGIMVMELAEGKDVDRSFRELSTGKNTDRFLEFYEKMKKLYVHFTKNALFGDGFFHGDLHKGNMFYEPKNQKLTLIDFGNAHSLTPDQQEAILFLLKGLKSGQMETPAVTLGIRQLLGLKGEPGEDKIFEEVVNDIITNCVFHETSDEQILALLDKWKNGRNNLYRKYQTVLDSVIGLCLSPMSNSTRVMAEIHNSEDASTRLKIILNFLNNVSLKIPEPVESFIQSKCMLESQIRVINGDLSQKDIRADLITRPEDIFDRLIQESTHQ